MDLYQNIVPQQGGSFIVKHCFVFSTNFVICNFIIAGIQKMFPIGKTMDVKQCVKQSV